MISAVPTEEISIAVLVPCFNEAATIAGVVADFSRVLPEATVYVFDNMSTDDTAQVARSAGAVVVRAMRRGKGSVVRKMFSEVEADIYLMVDGDGTYEPEVAALMVDRLRSDVLDMVVGARVPSDRDGREYPSGHAMGNKFFSQLYSAMFDSAIGDAFSGYRAMSRRFVKSFPATTSGFDIETELLAHASELKLEFCEIPARYYSRPDGSESKLGTYTDGIKILWSALRLFRDVHPKRFFGFGAVLLTLAALILGVPVIEEFIETGLVLRLPTALLAVALQLIAFLLLTCGFIISSVRQVSREQRRLAYLAVSMLRPISSSNVSYGPNPDQLVSESGPEGLAAPDALGESR
ncbi:unannotated protein [freshwater metagenome]|uniref:Unannotated protein n=1 Tax=freshwater metagenome TaxID=449393 RepID=A0A6J7H826_9ZZZZ|nr:glycosyltransferase [Actinomycetota bacterium]MSY80224.1 glycosyltransferase [Actinomycetota bacterium]